MIPSETLDFEHAVGTLAVKPPASAQSKLVDIAVVSLP
jgi:hypothetical protein